MPAWELALSTGTLHTHCGTLAAIELTRQAGFASVEIVLQGPEEHTLAFARVARRACAALGLRVVALHPRAEYLTCEDYVESATSELLQIVAQQAQLLAAQMLVLHGPHDWQSAAEWQRGLAGIRDLARLTAQRGVALTLETVSWGYLRTPDHVAALSCALAEEEVSITLDTFQAARAGYEPQAFFDAAPRRIRHLHFTGCAAHCASRNLPDAAATRSLAGLLHRNRYQGAVVLESSAAPELPRLQSARRQLAALLSSGGRS